MSIIQSILPEFLKKRFERSPEDEVLSGIDKEFSYMVRDFEKTLRLNLKGGDAMKNGVSLKLDVLFHRSIWLNLVAQEIQKLRKEDNEEFLDIMLEELGCTDAQNGETLQINLDLDSPDPHSVGYFTGFMSMKGYQKFHDICEKYGLEAHFFFSPEDDDMAMIGFYLSSLDGRPILNCITNPPSLDGLSVHDHATGCNL